MQDIATRREGGPGWTGTNAHLTSGVRSETEAELLLTLAVVADFNPTHLKPIACGPFTAAQRQFERRWF